MKNIEMDGKSLCQFGKLKKTLKQAIRYQKETLTRKDDVGRNGLLWFSRYTHQGFLKFVYIYIYKKNIYKI